MPTYQYACTDCGDESEVVQRFTDDPLTVCAACGGRLRKVFSPVGIVFKGSGFYRTDSRNGSNVPAGKDGAAAKDGAGKDSAAGKDGSASKDGAGSGSSGSSADSGASSSSSSGSSGSSGGGSAKSGTSEKKSSVAASSKRS